jgi:hypothetical protein
VLDACLVAGVAVPYEATVLGVNNDVLVCETCIPPLSSIAVDAEKAGFEAARILDELMRRSSRRQQIVTYGPTGVVSRASTDTLQVEDRLVIRALEFIRINAGLGIRASDVAEHLGVTQRWSRSASPSRWTAPSWKRSSACAWTPCARWSQRPSFRSPPSPSAAGSPAPTTSACSSARLSAPR